MSTTERRYRRKTHYPGHLSVAVTISTQRALEAVADQAGCSTAEVVRECLEVGLPVVKSRLEENGEPPVDPI